jgi:hypothetical protein
LDPRYVIKGGFNLTNSSTSNAFEVYFGFTFNTWVQLGYCPECLDNFLSDASEDDGAPDVSSFYINVVASRTYPADTIFHVIPGWLALYFVCSSVLLIAGIISTILESITIAPDVLGYASSVARNSRYIVMPKTSSAMSAGERLLKIGRTEVMMQDVNADAPIGRIALGNKHEKAHRLEKGKVYR